MSRGKFQRKRKPFPIIMVLLIVLLMAGLSTGGAVAYLAKSADPVTNTFEIAQNPTLTVNEDNSVTVGKFGYAVYVRAAVVPNLKSGNDVIMTTGTFEVVLEDDSKWFEHGGFYYYRLPVQSGGQTSPIYSTVTTDSSRGGILDVDIAAQAIQAVGTTDVTAEEPIEKSAVLDAWGIQPDA